MASLNQIVYNIASLHGDPTDIELINRLKFQVEYHRALLIRRDSAQVFNVPDQMTTTLRYEMELVDAVEGCDVALPCKFLRTTLPVPTPLNIKGAGGFFYVGAVDGQQGYQYVTQESLLYALTGKFSGGSPKFFYSGGYIYTVNSSAMCIDVKMVVESPVTGGPGGGGVTCIDPDAEYPITLDMIARVTQSILATEFSAQRPPDDEQIEAE